MFRGIDAFGAKPFREKLKDMPGLRMLTAQVGLLKPQSLFPHDTTQGPRVVHSLFRNLMDVFALH